MHHLLPLLGMGWGGGLNEANEGTLAIQRFGQIGLVFSFIN